MTARTANINYHFVETKWDALTIHLVIEIILYTLNFYLRQIICFITNSKQIRKLRQKNSIKCLMR